LQRFFEQVTFDFDALARVCGGEKTASKSFAGSALSLRSLGIFWWESALIEATCH
jgi:hypothetical protein